ncbi:kinesin-domain-containing protein [Hesseltinella vesiculosa]|uniref:Kinesin-domain-containing protein n=1 Tax=Hesseltinella vesiculosa TaxID=101127 RepID=A0A1X2GPL7_9FUNG|nr:kinesin-domain-containing protein [Hesseltinella vesiculosa]
MSNSGNIKVVVRCRPLNDKELARGATSLVRMEGNQTIVSRISPYATTIRRRQSVSEQNEEQIKAFTFDRSFWSGDPANDHYASQAAVYDDLGQELLDHAFGGYNCCIFAYGQTGSGKSYTMMGYGDDKGIIPRTSADLFDRIQHMMVNDATLHYQVEVSYLEIYNEKVRDLLNPRNKSNLKVREHPSLGPYVEDLSRLAVNTFDDIECLIQQGNKARTVAATNMNETSSRSHAVFTIYMTSRKTDQITNLDTEKVSRISLVDLAGSERVVSSGATGVRLKEGANINRSLATLGKVIAALAERSASADIKTGKKKAKDFFIPYRDSVLTWLLKDSLGGNSKTAMIATISPVDYEETLSTLRYADQAKRIKNKPVVNEDPNAKLIRELKEELQTLRDALMSCAPDQFEKIAGSLSPRVIGSKSTPRLGHAHPPPSTSNNTVTPFPVSTVSTVMQSTMTVPDLQSLQLPASPPAPPANKNISFADAHGETKVLSMKELVDQFKASQKLLDQVNQTWEQKMAKTQEIHQERERALAALGILLESSTMAIHTPKQMPHLVNLNEDPLMSECLVYQLKQGHTRVGHFQSPNNVDIRLSGHSILESHCYFDYDSTNVTLVPLPGAMVMVNGLRIQDPRQLHNGYRVILGDYHVFRFNHPEEVRRERDRHGPSPVPLQTNTSVTVAASVSSVPLQPLHPPFQDTASLPALYGNTTASGRTSQMTDRSESPFFFFSSSDRDSSSISHGHDPLDGLPSAYQQPGPIDPETMAHTLERSAMNTRLSFLSEGGFAPTAAASGLVDHHISSRHSVASMDDRALYSSSPSSSSGIPPSQPSYRRRRQLSVDTSMDLKSTFAPEDPMVVKMQQMMNDMQRKMDEQKVAYECKLKRLSSRLGPSQLSPIATDLSPHDRYLADKVLTRWRKLRYVLMSEHILSHAVFVKEANIIAKELGKDVVYQFTIVHDDLSVTSTSFWEATSNLALSSLQPDHDPSLACERKPCVGVQVIDKKRQTISYWSLQSLKQRLEQMRQLYEFSDQPLSRRHHFSWQDPFYQSSPSPRRFTLIGLASVPLQNIALHTPVETTVDIFDRHQCAALGRLTVRITPIARSMTAPIGKHPSSRTNHHQLHHRRTLSCSAAQPAISSEDDHGFTPQGQQFIVEVKLVRVLDLSEDDFSQVHAQFRASSFGHIDPLADDDKTYASEPISGFGIDPVELNYTQTLTIPIKDSTLATIMHGDLTIEVYGRAQLGYLYQVVDQALEREQIANEDPSPLFADPPIASWLPSKKKEHLILQPPPLGQRRRPSATKWLEDETNTNTTSVSFAEEPTMLSPQETALSSPSTLPPTTPTLPRHRRIKLKAPVRSYTDDGLVMKERHHAVAWLQICELNDQGDYVPTHVTSSSLADPGCFHLRQGVQRRIRLTMMHDSGLQLPWKTVTSLQLHSVTMHPDDPQHNQSQPQEISEEDRQEEADSQDSQGKSVSVTILKDSFKYRQDGTCVLSVSGPWDSSLHDSTQLNRLTPAQQRIHVTLSWLVSCSKTTEPLSFSMTIMLKVHHVNASLTPSLSPSPSFFQQLLAPYLQPHQQQQVTSHYRGLFSVHLSPPLTRRVSQLWRINTGNKYVRGEEILGASRIVRGISLVMDYRQARPWMAWKMQVSRTQQRLILFDQHHQPLALAPVTTNPDQLLYKTLDLWTSRFGSQDEIFINPHPPAATPMSPMSTISVSSMQSTFNRRGTALKLAPRIKFERLSDVVTKKGYLQHMEIGEREVWTKHWFVLRRPYLLVYPDATEGDELAVIDLTSASVDYKKDLVHLIKKPFAFSIYTAYNSYMLHAKDNDELMGWIQCIDQFYFVDHA